MIDWSRVTELREEIGTGDFPEVVELFLSEVEEELGTLEQAREAGILAARLHFLKGSALNLGFADFSDHCRKGEITVWQGGADQVDLGEIQACYAASKAQLLGAMDRM